VVPNRVRCRQNAARWRPRCTYSKERMVRCDSAKWDPRLSTVFSVATRRLTAGTCDWRPANSRSSARVSIATDSAFRLASTIRTWQLSRARQNSRPANVDFVGRAAACAASVLQDRRESVPGACDENIPVFDAPASHFRRKSRVPSMTVGEARRQNGTLCAVTTRDVTRPGPGRLGYCWRFVPEVVCRIVKNRSFCRSLQGRIHGGPANHLWRRSRTSQLRRRLSTPC
jgi:hypothetical protein